MVRRQRCMCFYLRYLFAGSLLADDNEIRHARSLNTYNNFILNNFTNQFDAQNFSVFTPFHSFLVLKLGATDYLPGHIFLLDAFIADVPTISRHVFKSEI